MLPDNTNADTGAKRRACDECRSRKLACSKHADGCERCKREDIVCHYSEQKPMGRPRKRQFIESARDEPTTAQTQHNESFPDSYAVPLIDGFSGYNDSHIVEPYFTDMDPLLLLPMEEQNLEVSNGFGLPTMTDGQLSWRFGSRDSTTTHPIDFSDIDVNIGVGGMVSLDREPQLSTSPDPSSTNSNELSENSTGSCSCLASMYLSLAALQQFPSDITKALQVVRAAAATAGESIWCPVCGAVTLTSGTPPIDAFQNTMLLGTILPIIANGYGRLLKMIDDETANAIATGRTKRFEYLEYGGLCERQKPLLESIECIGKALPLANKEMQPAEWRRTVRALLRVDIYGHEQPGFKMKGLKDILTEMEHRQNARHDILDAQAAAGLPPPEGHFPDLKGGLCLGERTRGCMEILKMAKLAIDSIVIA
ncbi:C6 finger domain-containing protein [Rutstroemia sp. NJR-2017a WRK4]|nr:C6 finger domain-containing protein [Rutstroemia sp. NJR-2017a WRK4]PQE14821.1 C6 finger domain-containing protein [Rutstroemia sp. NJR-2017a WRK4]